VKCPSDVALQVVGYLPAAQILAARILTARAAVGRVVTRRAAISVDRVDKAAAKAAKVVVAGRRL
jgi:hypothetical protein